MFQLTHYQEQALESLRLYLRHCAQTGDADLAFYETTRIVWKQGIPYRPVGLSELAQIPYVCLRLPTGGGKTLLACHAISVANQEYLTQDHSLVLWLVPSNTIREQTLNALIDHSHPYRQALDSTLGPVTAMGIDEALYLRQSVLIGSTTIIVATIQAFRVEDKEGRQVYSGNGNLDHHFTHLTPEIEGKLLRTSDTVLHSLANVLRIHRPLVIVDEAHNARTALSFDTLANFRPSAIIEFTATPDSDTNPSNVLHSVSAAELKAENMIKLPIRLETKSEWRSVLADAVSQRQELEKRAGIERQKTGEYIRPLLLLQAQPKRKDQETLSVDVLKAVLTGDCHIPTSQVAIATGDQRDLDGIDILAEGCEIRYIVTVQALAEGWDCPFAYVLCSVREMTSGTAVEQILGRILRLPHRQSKQDQALNRAYAFVTSSSFAAAAKALIDALVENGFNAQEAREFIRIAQPNQPDLGVEDGTFRPKPRTIRLAEVPPPENLPQSLRAKIEVDTKNRTVTVKGYLLPEEEEAFSKQLILHDAKDMWKLEVGKYREEIVEILKSPSERSLPFKVPQLCVRDGETLDLFEEQQLIDHGWELSGFDACLTGAEYARLTAEVADSGEIDISDKGKVQSRFIPELNRELQLIEVVDDNWTQGQLIRWLDCNLVYYELTPTDKEQFLSRLLGDLIDMRGMPLAQAVRRRFDVRKIVEAKINDYRKVARSKAHQELLFGDTPAEVVVTAERCFAYHPDQYPMRSACPASHLFRKHYYPKAGEIDSQGEEFECAVYLDQLPEVEYWVRNLERQPVFSFWLQTATDKFYPDFVCKLTDGRYLVVEYKGQHLYDNPDSREKRRLGELWEAKSAGGCLFHMTEGDKLTEIAAKIRR